MAEVGAADEHLGAVGGAGVDPVAPVVLEGAAYSGGPEAVVTGLAVVLDGVDYLVVVGEDGHGHAVAVSLAVADALRGGPAQAVVVRAGEHDLLIVVPFQLEGEVAMDFARREEEESRLPAAVLAEMAGGVNASHLAPGQTVVLGAEHSDGEGTVFGVGLHRAIVEP